MKKGIIFCVDDEKIVLNGLKTELKNSFGNNYIIETAENATEALNTIDDLLASGHEIPVIISDYAMPLIKGDELLAKVHHRSPLTLKILLTGQATIEGVTNSINNAGLFRYISKPWETHDLILSVEQAIKSYDQEIQLERQNKELRELSSSLEKKVEERTLQLQNMNNLLLEKQEEISLKNEELENHRNNLEKLVQIRTHELTLAKEKAEESEKLKSAFMANISHEIRTPMNGIIGFIELLKDQEYEKVQQYEFLENIELCSNQLMNIITDIVEISKLETNMVKPVLAECEIIRIMDSTLAMFKQTVGANSTIVLKSIFARNQIVCLTDHTKLKQILSNLISNAIKNTPYGTIELDCSILGGKEILFSVKDSGIGIPTEYHDTIFDRFRQVDTTLTRKHGGTGLGLAISKAYVELLGGKIWLESTPGVGSTFYFTIEYHPINHVEETDQRKKVDSRKGFEHITILVAEDMDHNYKYLDILLSREKMNVIRAIDGDEAVNMCKNNPKIDLVLMDVKMPKLNGFEATKKILEFRKDIPIIAQTAYAFSDDKIMALECGCVDYIAKPIKGDILKNLIYKHLAKKLSD